MNPLNKHLPTDKNHVLVVIKMLTAESAGLCKLLTGQEMTKLSNSSYCQTLIPNHSSSARRLGKEWDFSNFFFLASVCLFCLFFLLFALLPQIFFKGK